MLGVTSLEPGGLPQPQLYPDTCNSPPRQFPTICPDEWFFWLVLGTCSCPNGKLCPTDRDPGGQ